MLLLKHHCLFCFKKVAFKYFSHICSHSNYEKDVPLKTKRISTYHFIVCFDYGHHRLPQKATTTVKAVLPADSLLREGDLVFRRGAGLIRPYWLPMKTGQFSTSALCATATTGWWCMPYPENLNRKGDSDRVKWNR